MTWTEALREIVFPSDSRLQLMWLLVGIALGVVLMDWWRSRKP